MTIDQANETPSQVEINAQYLKDLSFESPKAPLSLVMTNNEKPTIDLSVNIAAERVQEHTYEVALHVTAKALSAGETVFLVDTTYAGLFTMTDLDAERRDIMLFVFCPTMLFPFLRRIVSDATRDGGFPPLMLSPIDFMTLFRQRGASAEGVPAGESVN
jgi:preprotein translocase subunit SecB